MNLKPLPWTLLPLALLPALADGSSPSQAPIPDPPQGPRIQFESSIFDFGRINSGENVTHAFVFTNTGDQVLEITRVQPGCGCTTAGTWDKRVEPGAQGSIPLQFNSAGFSGRVTKTATVHCNDQSHSNVVLQLTGTIWKPIETTPSLVMFTYGEEGQTQQTKSVRIVNNLETPVALSGLTCTNASFKAALETVKPGHEFLLHVTALPHSLRAAPSPRSGWSPRPRRAHSCKSPPTPWYNRWWLCLQSRSGSPGMHWLRP